jgi:hypothetical protein
VAKRLAANCRNPLRRSAGMKSPRYGRGLLFLLTAAQVQRAPFGPAYQKNWARASRMLGLSLTKLRDALAYFWLSTIT